MTTATALQYETIIGLEVHAQLVSSSKMFCACLVGSAEAPPNTHVCPVCLGMPGVLPVINKQAVEKTIMTGLVLNCEIPEQAKFDRKNYPYPDLMKGYQISQYDLPLCRNGWLEIEVDGRVKRIGITRVHLEEDTARLVHVRGASGETYSLVDVNRSGVPLMEIVSEPDLRSPEETRAYLVKLQQIMRYIGASRANMEEGNMRCEPNVSVRPLGSGELGAKVELKNINSFRHVYEAIRYEVQRQIGVLEAGGRIVQETRGWREDLGQAVPQRSKEYAHDYRYFPEPDLPPLAVSRQWVEEIRRKMPELPDAKRARFREQYALSDYDATLLTQARSLAGFFEKTMEEYRAILSGQEVSVAHAAKIIANWVLGDVSRLLNVTGLDIDDAGVELTPASFAKLLGLLQAHTISAASAKQVLEETFRTGRDPQQIVAEQGLLQITAADQIAQVVEEVLAANAQAVADYRAGKETALKFLIGQVMRATKGRASPAVVNQLLVEKLGEE